MYVCLYVCRLAWLKLWTELDSGVLEMYLGGGGGGGGMGNVFMLCDFFPSKGGILWSSSWWEHHAEWWPVGSSCGVPAGGGILEW